MAAEQVAENPTVQQQLVVGSIVVALSTPYNLVLLLLCSTLRPDTNPLLLLLLGGVTNIGLFLALCVVALLALRRAMPSRRKRTLTVILITYVVLEFGCSVAALLQMAVTEDYL
jgi:hypothetical protein